MSGVTILKLVLYVFNIEKAKSFKIRKLYSFKAIWTYFCLAGKNFGKIEKYLSK